MAFVFELPYPYPMRIDDFFFGGKYRDWKEL